MPIAKVTCSICKETVNKAQTLSIGRDQRACRKHEETKQQAQASQTQLEAKHAEGRHRPPRVRKDIANLPLQPKCFCCQTPGIRLPDLLLEILVCNHKFEEAYGKQPFFKDETDIAYASLKDLIVLYYVSYKTELDKHIHRHALPVAKMTGFLLACHACCEKCQMKKYNALEGQTCMPSFVLE
jgi:hypothetical protein